MRREEYFKKRDIPCKESVSNTPPFLYPQERDWTCSIACIRTILSAIEEEVLGEEEIVTKYNMLPGPYYSKDLKTLGILNSYDVKYGCDDKNVTFEDIIAMVKDGYYVMLECMVNYAHWFVLLGYYTHQDFTDIEKANLLLFDPYYNQVRLMNVDEFINMWMDGNYANTGVEKDYIAFK